MYVCIHPHLLSMYSSVISLRPCVILFKELPGLVSMLYPCPVLMSVSMLRRWSVQFSRRLFSHCFSVENRKFCPLNDSNWRYLLHAQMIKISFFIASSHRRYFHKFSSSDIYNPQGSLTITGSFSYYALDVVFPHVSHRCLGYFLQYWQG